MSSRFANSVLSNQPKTERRVLGQGSKRSFLTGADSGHSPGWHRQFGSDIMVVYATEILRALRPASDASTANGIATSMVAVRSRLNLKFST